MRQETQGLSTLPVIRVISTPIPSARLSRDLAAQLRAMYEDLLREPVPERLLATAGLSQAGTNSPSTQEMRDGPATSASGVDR